MDYIRDYVMYAAIFGMFSVCWFGWAQERPRASWRVYISIASGIALLVGVYLSVTHWDAPSALNDKTAFGNYLISVYVEFFLAAVGAVALMRWKRKDYVAPWIAFIVGIHFIGLKSVFDNASLYVLAALLVIVSIISVLLAPKLKVANSALTGIGSGAVLFAFAIMGLIRYFTA